MPQELILEDGTKIEALTAEEVAELKTKADKAEEITKELEANKEKLAKLENKDFNFKKLRDMSEDEREKLTATEIELKRKQEEIDDKQQNFQKNIKDSWMNEALTVYAGDDNELRKKIVLNYSKLKNQGETKEEIFNNLRDAYNMAGHNSSANNPLHAMNSYSGGYAPGNTPDKALKDVDEELARNLGITKEDLKRYEAFPHKHSSAETGKKGGFQR